MAGEAAEYVAGLEAEIARLRESLRWAFNPKTGNPHPRWSYTKDRWLCNYCAGKATRPDLLQHEADCPYSKALGLLKEVKDGQG